MHRLTPHASRPARPRPAEASLHFVPTGPWPPTGAALAQVQAQQQFLVYADAAAASGGSSGVALANDAAGAMDSDGGDASVAGGKKKGSKAKWTAEEVRAHNCAGCESSLR